MIGALSLYMSIDRPDSLALLTQFGVSAIISGIIAPVSLGYFWRNANKAGATSSFMLLTGADIVSNVFQALYFSSIVGFVFMVSVSLVAEYSLKRMNVICAGQQI